MGTEMERRARSFERNAEAYDEFRPGYPAEMLADLCAIAGDRLAGRVLEIGAGTGRATLPLARAGARVDVVEPSADMLGVLATRLEREGLTDRVLLRQATFEEVNAEARYDAVVCAQAFHWADEDTRMSRLASLIEPEGLAFLFWNSWAIDGDVHPHKPIRELYDSAPLRCDPDLGGNPTSGEWILNEIDAAPQVELAERRWYEWPWQLPTERYLRLLRTTSQYAIADDASCTALLDRLAELLGERVVVRGSTFMVVVRAAGPAT